jgi:hypothetical protein
MKKVCSLALVLLAVAFVIGGGYSMARGVDAKDRVRDELLAQKIKTPGDASIPNAAVDDARTAQAMGDVIGVHSLRATGGRTYAEFGRYAALDGNSAGTDDEAKAVKGANGRPVPHPLRGVAFEASALRTSLYTSVMAFNIADLVIGLGLMMLAIGVVIGGAGVAIGRSSKASVAYPVKRTSPTLDLTDRSAADGEQVAAALR